MLSTEKYYRDLYNLLKVKGYKPVALDYNRDKVNPEEAVAIEFSFKKDGKEYGVAYITIDKSVTLYFVTNFVMILLY